MILKTEKEGQKIIIYKEAKNAQQFYLEHWNNDGFITSLKLPKCGQVYNNAVFGGINWSDKADKITFIAEKEQISEYKPYWDSENQKPDSENKPPPDFFNKYMYNGNKSTVHSSFGEIISSNKCPVIVIYDLGKKKIKILDIQELHQEGKLGYEFEGVYPAFPTFDKTGEGIVFQGFTLPVEKLGLIYWYNRYTMLYYISNYEDNSDELDKPAETTEEKPEHKYDVRVLTHGFYYAGFPKFSNDYHHLTFFGSEQEFTSHNTAFGLYTFKNFGNADEELYWVVEREHEENDQFSGLYGFHDDFMAANFIKDTHIFVVGSVNKGREIVCSIDVDSKTNTILECPNDSTKDSLNILSIQEDLLFLTASSMSQTPITYLLHKMNTDSPEWYKIDQISTRSIPREYWDFLSKVMESIKIDTFSVTSGTEGYFIRCDDPENALFPDKKKPCILMIHGGPHGSAPKNKFIKQRLHLLSLGYNLCVVNYRGSLGYGLKNVEKLWGNIFDMDVQDCMDLLNHWIEVYQDEIDQSRLGIYGGSHGGYLTCSIISHPDYRFKFAAAWIWNPVTSIHSLLCISDIPDWWYSSAVGSPHEWYLNKDGKFRHPKLIFIDVMTMYDKSPISRVLEVNTPSIFIIGEGDLRCPPSQGLYFYRCLKSSGIDTEWHYYPGEGHSVPDIEKGLDANMNLIRWWIKYLK